MRSVNEAQNGAARAGDCGRVARIEEYATQRSAWTCVSPRRPGFEAASRLDAGQRVSTVLLLVCTVVSGCRYSGAAESAYW